MERTHFTFKERKFTLQEMRVLSLKAFGLTNQQIGAYLRCAIGTVKTHLKNICKMLNRSGSQLLISEALEGGFDRKGNYKGTYLFDGYKGDLPWHSR